MHGPEDFSEQWKCGEAAVVENEGRDWDTAGGTPVADYWMVSTLWNFRDFVLVIGVPATLLTMTTTTMLMLTLMLESVAHVSRHW